MTPPGLTCVRCERHLYPELARATNTGWAHVECTNANICATCDRGLVPKRRWAAMSAEERAEAGAAGLTCKATARTCRRCDLAARRIASPAAPRPPRPARLGPTRTAAERKEDEARERTNRLEDIEWMVETGESWDGVLRRLGLSDSGAKAFLVRVDRADLIARLDRKRVTA